MNEKAYWVAIGDVTDAERYREYGRLAPLALERFGGKILVRGGQHVLLEGGPLLPRIVIIEFPSMAHAQSFYSSPEYAEAKKHREGAGIVQAMFLVNGVGE